MRTRTLYEIELEKKDRQRELLVFERKLAVICLASAAVVALIAGGWIW